MPLEVLQRLTWTGTPYDLGDLFVLHKNRRLSRARLFTHAFGWEVRLVLGAAEDVVRTQVCRTEDEVLTTGQGWKAPLQTEGWA